MANISEYISRIKLDCINNLGSENRSHTEGDTIMDAEIEPRPTGFKQSIQVARKYSGIILIHAWYKFTEKTTGGKVCSKAITVKITCAVQSQPDT